MNQADQLVLSAFKAKEQTYGQYALINILAAVQRGDIPMSAVDGKDLPPRSQQLLKKVLEQLSPEPKSGAV